MDDKKNKVSIKNDMFHDGMEDSKLFSKYLEKHRISKNNE